MIETRRWALRIEVGLFALALALGAVGAAGAGEVTVTDRRVFTDGKRLLLDLRLKDLFSDRARTAIEAGLTTGLAIELRLGVGRRRGVDREIAFEIRHDIWEGQYLVLKRAAPPDTLRTAAFDAVERFCANVDSVELAPLDALRPGEPLDLKFRTRLELVTPEQARRTRKWLEAGDDDSDDPSGVRIDFGDIIDFFFNIHKPEERSGWIDLGRFTGRFTGRFVLEEVR